ncbi:MAG: zinc transporter ZupT [Eubacteriales bacterium]|nr:zinc transporter ZupT [Eubacteriales bacterium]
MTFDSHTILVAFGLTLFAGLSTGIGSLIAWTCKRTNTRFLSVVLGFSAGVMIYVSMIEIFGEANTLLTAALGTPGGTWVTVAGFFGGMLIIALIDKLVPAADNPHEMRMVESMSDEDDSDCGQKRKRAVKKSCNRGGWHMNKAQCDIAHPHHRKLMRLGVFTALAIAIHNFPEGIATFFAALKDPSLGITIAVAIAIHNIPEGIAVSVPVYFATGDRKKALKWSMLSGLSEPLGALVAYLVLMQFMNDIIFGIVFACVAGIMVFISLDEILPTAREYGEPHLSIYGMVAGMAVMAVSLILFI